MIHFSNPSALWLLTLIAPLILLYLLKRRRRDLVVPSLLLWKQALEDTKAHRPFQKLRSQLLLYLQILALVLITAILSEPHLLQSARPSRRLVLVMDVSASMQATDVSPDRFHAAREQLARALDQSDPNDDVLLIAMGSEPSVIQPFTTQHSLVRAKLMEMEPEDTAGNWSRLRQILESLLKEHPAPQIVIASDFSGIPEDMVSQVPFLALHTGESGSNVAIIRMAAEALPEMPEKQQLFYRIHNYSTSPQSIDVELHVEERVVDAYAANLGPGSNLDRSAELTVASPAKVELRIEPPDFLMPDNSYTLIVTPAESMKVSAQYQNAFLLKALGAIPSVQITRDAKAVIDQTDVAQPGSVPGIHFALEPAEEGGPIVQWNSAHPVLRFVEAGMWKMSRCTALVPPPDATILMETTRGTAAYALETDAGRSIVLGFRIEDSNLFQLAGFPVFLQNALQWIQEGNVRQIPSLTGPDGKKEGPYDWNGIHGYRNFASATESRIQPSRAISSSVAGAQNLPRRLDLSKWFLILAITIVMLEWWAFHRRIDL